MAYLTAEEHGLNNHIALCSFCYPPVGNIKRTWTKEILRPYILYIHENKPLDTFFGGLLFEADMSENGEQLSARAMGFGAPPTPNGWTHAKELLFEREHNLWAALEVSKELPGTRKLDIWVALPYPFENQPKFKNTLWTHLDFSRNSEDRITALKWWVKEIESSWHTLCEKIPDHRARLCGFAWTKSSLAPNDETVIKGIADYIHGRQMKLWWCHNYGAARAIDVPELGFDFAFTRPTYTGIDPRGIDWIKYAAAFASHYHTGIGIWGEQRTSPYQTLDFLNVGNELFKNAFQMYDLPFQSVYEWYINKDPMYVYLYAYTKGAFTKIIYPNCKY